MNENLKNRIVGVIILLTLLIIIIPMLFKGSGQKELRYLKIEDQNDIKFKYIDEVKEVSTKNISKTDKLKIIVKENIIKDVKNLKEDSSNYKKKNWIIRIGTFSEKNNALKLLSGLKEIKHQANVIKLQKNNKILYAVNIGPYFSASEAKRNFLKIIKNNNYKDSYIIESNFKNN